MDEVILALIMSACGGLLGLILGSAATDNGWEQDCQLTGIHRLGKEVYTCAKRS